MNPAVGFSELCPEIDRSIPSHQFDRFEILSTRTLLSYIATIHLEDWSIVFVSAKFLLEGVRFAHDRYLQLCSVWFLLCR